MLWLIIPLSVLQGCAGEEEPATGDRTAPNIVLIVTDDQGWGDLSVHGNTNVRTPNIDALASRGASFSNFYVSPVCSPTRAELLTGRYHPRGGVYGTSAGGERLDLDETTIAEVFSRAGYATGVFGKWHNGMQYPYHPNGRGFDEFYGFASGHWGDYFSPSLLEHNGELVRGDGYLPDDVTGKALEFIEDHGGSGDPFLLYLPYNTPHSPMQVPDRWWEALEGRELAMRHRDPGKEDPAFTRAALAMVENIDWNVGRIMDKLRELELGEQTIVAYMSDNGPNSWRWNGGMRGRKGSTDEGGVRSPLFIRWPQVIEPGTEIPEIAAAIDLLPTLSDLAGVKLQTRKPVDGISLVPLLSGGKQNWDERLIFSHWNGRTSVRSPAYRLDHQGRLYDITEDRGQHREVSSRHPQVTETLRDTLQGWERAVIPEERGETKRPFLVGDPDFKYTQLPARDGRPHGNIERSNRFPNASFFTNWTSTADSISWDVEVREPGTYRVKLYYTCPPKDLGTVVQLSFGSAAVTDTIRQAHNPPLRGMEDDRVERIESYVKDFKPLEMGTIALPGGRAPLVLRALEIPGSAAMDFRTLMLTRID